MTKNYCRTTRVVSLLVAASVCWGRTASSAQATASQPHRDCAGLEPYQRETYHVDVRQWREMAISTAKAMDSRVPVIKDRPLPPFDVSRLDRMIAATPSEFEDPGSYELLSRLVDDVDKARSTLNFTLATRPCFGTLPIPTVNARVARVGTEARPYIVVNRSLFSFVHEMTKLALLTVEFARAAPPAAMTISFGPDAYERQLSRYPEIRDRMADLVSEYLGGPRAQSLILGVEYDTLLLGADEGAELFAVAHEYAHLILNHLATSKLAELRLLTDPSHPTTAGPQSHVHTWLQETDADVTAMKLTEEALDLRHAREGATPLNVLTEFSRRAPLLFLRYSDIVQEALDIKLNGQLPSRNDELTTKQIDALKRARRSRGDEIAVPGVGGDAHPPAPVRVAILRDSVKGWEGLSGVQQNVNEHAFERLAERLDEGIQRLWRESRPLLLESTQTSTTGPWPDPVTIVLTGPAEPNTLTLVVGLHVEQPGTTRPGVTVMFVNQGKQCAVPGASTVRFTSRDGFTVARPAGRLSQEKDADLCTEGVAAILRHSEAAMLATASSMTIEFAGRQISLSPAQLEDFRLGLGNGGARAKR
jgi:hypothetical protein